MTRYIVLCEDMNEDISDVLGYDNIYDALDSLRDSFNDNLKLDDSVQCIVSIDNQGASYVEYEREDLEELLLSEITPH
jgi:hypothetical protein